MKAYLIQIDAWSGATAIPVRLASHNDERLCHLDGKTWWPAIAALPTLRYDFFDGAFDAGSITSPSGDMSVALNAIPSLPALSLHDTRIRIWRGELGDAWGGFSLMFDGRVQEQPATTEGIASIKFGVDDSWLDQPLLATYGGTGGADGPPDIQGEVKPLALGAPRFAPAVLIDAVDNIYQLSSYGAINAVEMAFERLNRFGAPTGNAENFASLKAATIAPGKWATCLAGGYVRFGAPPDGLLSFHVQGDAVGGWSRKPGDLIARIATIGGGAGKFSTGDMTALNAARPWNLSVMVTAQTTARELIQRIAASVNAVAFVDWLGQLRVAPIGIGTASLTLASDGSALPPVASVEQVAVAAPYWKIAQGAAVTWQVHGLNDIAFNAPLNPRGPYNAAEEYREGDMVTLPNGSQWLFVGTTPATGSTPGPGNANWYRLADDITAGNITYEDGTPVEELKPAEPGATNGASPEEKDLLEELDVASAQHTANIAAAQATITTMQSDAAAMQAALSTAQGQITAQGAAILANANDIATVQSTVASQGASITSLQTTASTHTGQIATINNTLTTQGAAITTAQSAITTLQGSMATLTTTVTTQGGSITTLQSSVTTLQGSVSTLQSTVSTQGASITANSSAITTLQGSVATLETRVTATGGNLCPNSTFENGMDGWSFNSASWDVVPNAYGWGSFASTGTDPGDGGFIYIYRYIPVEEGSNYTLSADMGQFISGGTGVHYTQIQFMDASNGVLDTTIGFQRASGPNFDPTGQSRQALKVTAFAPTGTAKAQISLVWFKGSGTVQSFHVRQVKFERGAIATPYSQEASIVQSFQALSTLTTQYASLSSTVSTQGVTITSQQTAITTINNNVTTLFGRAGVTVDVNGRVTGWEINNNGTTGSFTIRSDRFRVLPPSGTTNGFYIDIDGSNRTTQYILDGGVRVVELGWLA